MGWSRKLDPSWKPNPNWIGDGDPDYQIRILHVLPAEPQGSTQMWQIVKCMITTVDKTCKKQEEVIWITDVVNIGKRTEISDGLTLRRERDQLCHVIEKCEHTVGFDDGDPYEEYSSQEITKQLAEEILKRMKGPKDAFTTEYAWRSKDKKCDKCAKVDAPFALDPGEEALRVGGIGEYLPERLKKKDEAAKKSKGKSKP